VDSGLIFAWVATKEKLVDGLQDSIWTLPDSRWSPTRICGGVQSPCILYLATDFTRRKIHLEEEIYHLIDLNNKGLDKLDDEGLEDYADSNDYAFKGINLNETVLDEEGYSNDVDSNGLSKDDKN